MYRDSRRRRPAVAALFGLVVPLLMASPGSGQPADGPLAPYVKGLDTAERKLLLKVAAGELCPCPGAAASLKRCLEKPSPCAAARHTGERLRGWIVKGLGYSQVVDELIRYVEEQASRPSNFDLTQTACKGPADAPAQVVSFSDFECPHCRRAAEIAEELFRKHKGKVRLCFKHFPLNYHLNARYAATVSVLLHSKGKFWPFHDRMFELADKDQLTEETIRAAAAELGAPLDQAAAALQEAAAAVRRDKEEGAGAGVGGTPSFYVNGRALPDKTPLAESLAAAVAKAIEGGTAAGQSPPARPTAPANPPTEGNTP